METDVFIARLGEMGPDDLRSVASALRHEVATVEGELSWWRATTSVAVALRSHRRSREAARLAHAAVVAVQAAGTRCGLGEAEAQTVTTVARAAADATRALVADHDAVAASPLIAPFEPLLSPLAA
jgi:hypothetical protein